MDTPSLSPLCIMEHLSGIEEALAGAGTHTILDLAQELEDGDAQLWMRPGALIVSRIHDYPRGREIFIWVATGELQACLDLSEDVLDWGRAQGATRAAFSGRRGWVRALQGTGWKEEETIMGREL